MMVVLHDSYLVQIIAEDTCRFADRDCSMNGSLASTTILYSMNDCYLAIYPTIHLYSSRFIRYVCAKLILAFEHSQHVMVAVISWPTNISTLTSSAQHFHHKWHSSNLIENLR